MKRFYLTFIVGHDREPNIIGLILTCPTVAPTANDLEKLTQQVKQEFKSHHVVCISCFPLHVEDEIEDEKFYHREFKLDQE